MSVDPVFVSNYDPTLHSRIPTFGFQTDRSHAYIKKRHRHRETAWKMASYIPMLGAFATIGLEFSSLSDAKRAYRHIRNRELIRKHIATARACNKELTQEFLLQKEEEFLRHAQSELLSLYYLLRKIPTVDLNEIKRFIDISPFEPFNQNTVEEKKRCWEDLKEDKKVEACDRLIRLIEEHDHITREELPKLEFLRAHYPGSDDLDIDIDISLFPKHSTRMLLSLFGIGVIALPVIDIIATIHNEYKAKALILEQLPKPVK